MIGEVIFLRLPIQPTIILCSVQSALDLLDKRSNIYSDRPPSVMDELLRVINSLLESAINHTISTTWDFGFAFMPYSLRWRRHRRYLHQYVHQGVVHNFRDLQRHSVLSFMKRMIDGPGEAGYEVRK